MSSSPGNGLINTCRRNRSPTVVQSLGCLAPTLFSDVTVMPWGSSSQYCDVYGVQVTKMTGSTSEDWILLSLQLQPLLITLSHNTNAIPHILQMLLTLVHSVLICIHNSLISLSGTTARVSLPSRVLFTAASLTHILCVGWSTNIDSKCFERTRLKTPLATHFVLCHIPRHHHPATSYQHLP
jgi:hypothetical protein